MKKVILFASIVFILAISCAVTGAGELVDGNVSLGQDHVQMMWYLVGYEKASPETGAPSGTVRKYYTNVGIKNETIELLMSKFGLDAEKAGSLYFTEYRYIYSADTKTFAVGYIRHYDMVGNLVYGTEMNGQTEETKLSWVGVVPKGPSGLALDVVKKAK